ncbi:hypothetical protein BGZ75_009327 [Mortierella antarctica]|nr:hypothetical protein BGZ75_009327 [Mortierella antarctica]
MTSIHPTVQRTSSGLSHRRRLPADTARKPKVVYPTTLQPDPQDRIPTMSIADSGLLQATLSQSRTAWTHSAFSRFIPEPAARGPGGKKYASELSLAGLCTVCIGPHMFLNTKFYTVINPPPPPPPLPPSTSSTASNSTAAPTPTEEYAHSPCSTPPVVLGGSPAPERVIELILARTADMAAEAAAAGTVPSTITPTLLDIDLPRSLMKDTHMSATKRDNETGDAMLKTEAMEGSFSSTARPAGSATRTKVPPPRQHRPKHQIAFEFKENPGCRWLFPHESSLELTPEEGQEPARISASFYLPTMEENPAGLSGYGSGSALVPGPGQATTMVILQATNELWAGLQHAINDPAATYRFMMDKMKNIPPRSYVQYKLPLDFPDEQLQPMGLKKLPDNKVVPLSSLVSPKRKQETNDQQQGSRSKRTKAGQDDLQLSGSKGARRTSSFADATSTLSRPRCAYCSVASTPRWRRGPDGPSSLCNKCGILWKRGKILQDVSSAGSTYESESSATEHTLSASGAMPITTTADAASRMRQESLGLTGDDRGYDEQYMRTSETGKRVTATSRLLSNAVDGGYSNGGTLGSALEGEKTSTSKRRGAKASVLESTGPKLVPIYQIGETGKASSRSAAASRRDRGDKGDKEKEKGKDKLKTKDKGREKDKEQDKGEITSATPASSPLTSMDASSSLGTTPSSTGASANDSAVLTSENSAAVATASPTAPKPGSESKSATSKAASTKTTTTGATRAGKQKANSGAGSATVTKAPHPASAGAKLSLLKAYASTPKYQISHPAAVATANLADDGLSFYATKNLYTNNTATFPLHFPTISIAFGPNNDYYMYPNCAMVLFENHFQIKLIFGGERTEIDVRKEGIEETEFQVVDVGDGESMIVMKALLRQQLTRFDKELLNPERNECLIVFRFRERLDGGGPPVKPLLEQWLKTEVPVASQVALVAGSGDKS